MGNLIQDNNNYIQYEIEVLEKAILEDIHFSKHNGYTRRYSKKVYAAFQALKIKALRDPKLSSQELIHDLNTIIIGNPDAHGLLVNFFNRPNPNLGKLVKIDFPLY